MKGVLNFLPRSAIEVVVYHSPCNDGHAAAALFHYYCDYENLEFIGLHPKDDLLTEPNIELLKNKNVVFVDICFSPQVMLDVSKLVKKAIVLDHHITNQDAFLEKDMETVKFHFEMGIPGCYLAWEYLCGDTPMPRVIEYIGLYDVFKHKNNPEAVFFNVAFERPSALLDWRRFIDDENDIIDNIITKGSILYEYRQSVLKIMAEKTEYCDWGEFRVAMINVPYPWISDMGELLCETVDPEKTVAVIWNKTMTGPFSLSFRSHEKVGPDVSKIAQQFGGGGHVHAAAARTEKGPWEIFKN
jgi:oligoribonuclease NrnB/cAMP/cGMP phosphodiesterase (DHH superfamily)